MKIFRSVVTSKFSDKLIGRIRSFVCFEVDPNHNNDLFVI